MGEAKNSQQATKPKKTTQSTKILWWNISKSYKQKLIVWTIEGVLISVVSLAISWLTFLFISDI